MILKIGKMKTLLKLLFKLDLINLSKLGGLIYDIEPNQAGAKLRNKVKEINSNKLTDNDWELILSALKSKGEKKENKKIDTEKLP
jgi:hypothetical protein